MAVARMLKVTAIGHRRAEEGVVEALQRVGVLDIARRTDDSPGETARPDEDRRSRLEEYAADAHFVRDFLARHHVPTQAFSSFVSEKFHMTRERFEACDDPAELLPLYRRCEEISDRTAALDRERARLVGLIADLAPWADVRLQVSRWRGTGHVALFAGTVPGSDGPAIRERLRACCDAVSVDEHGPVGSRAAWIVLAHRSGAEQVRSVLSASDFAETSFPGLTDYPAEEIEIARDRLEGIATELAELEERATTLAKEHYARAVAVAEAIDAERDSVGIRARFGATDATFAVRGWVPASQRAALEEALSPWADATDVTFAEPGDEDEPPVLLDNPRWLQPFETLTDLYGRPAYRELDPTPLLAPFFWLFFSICVGDVGYGAMLMLGAYLIKRKLDVAPGVRRFMDLLMLGGFGAILVGIAFASYFALDVKVLPAPLRAMQLLDPMARLTDFLVICIALGMTQVFFGVLVAAYDAWRRGDRAGAVFGQLSTLFLFAMIAVAVFVPGAAGWALPLGIIGTVLMQGDAILTALGETGTPLWDRAVGWTWLAAMAASVAVMATRGVGAGLALLAGASVAALVSHTGRRSVVALLGGAYSVYGMSAFIGDILSYTRLAALGLSGALVGMVFNLLAGLVWSGVAGLAAGGPAGWLAAALVAVATVAIFVVGHVFNVVINLLGAFVHPARLQFVEFFSKFYEGGGRVFDPFRYRTKSVVLGAVSPAGQEGAGS